MIRVTEDHLAAIGSGRIVHVIPGDSVVLGRDPIGRASQKSRHRAFPAAVKGGDPNRVPFWLGGLVLLDETDHVILPILGKMAVSLEMS
jgi:hypothetical protein